MLLQNYNKFQAVLARMDMVTEVKDFVFFYYDTVNLIPGGPDGLSVSIVLLVNECIILHLMYYIPCPYQAILHILNKQETVLTVLAPINIFQL